MRIKRAACTWRSPRAACRCGRCVRAAMAAYAYTCRLLPRHVTGGDNKSTKSFRGLTLAASLNGLAATVHTLGQEVRQSSGIHLGGGHPLRIEGNAEPAPAALSSSRRASRES